jgi:hypothetical protein
MFDHEMDLCSLSRPSVSIRVVLHAARCEVEMPSVAVDTPIAFVFNRAVQLFEGGHVTFTTAPRDAVSPLMLAILHAQDDQREPSVVENSSIDHWCFRAGGRVLPKKGTVADCLAADWTIPVAATIHMYRVASAAEPPTRVSHSLDVGATSCGSINLRSLPVRRAQLLLDDNDADDSACLPRMSLRLDDS